MSILQFSLSLLFPWENAFKRLIFILSAINSDSEVCTGESDKADKLHELEV